MTEYPNHIEFLLGFEPIRICFDSHSPYTPTTTLLQFLRSDVHHKGTKEGCAQGDCGACTVVTAEVENQKLVYKAVNACLIFIPQLNGKQIITIEHLAQDDHLHPVQQAMVDIHASQCGFCTPGFVMSLFALYKNPEPVNEEFIANSLVGNLCRCTGYRSIIDAAHYALAQKQPDRFSRNEQLTIQKLNQIKTADVLFENEKYSYFLPAHLDSALEWRNNHPSGVIIDGATDVALKVTKHEQEIPAIIDLSGIKELKFCNIHDGYIEVGASTSLETLRWKSSGVLLELSKILSVFGSKQIRNLATIGGNIAAASPIGDTFPLLMALEAKVILQTKSAKREVFISDFITGYRKTSLAEDELLTSVKIPLPKSVEIFVSKISKRTDMDIATVNAAMVLKLSSDKKVESIRLFYGGMGPTTLNARQTEAYLTGKSWDRTIIESATDYLESDLSPISDARASAEGRMLLAKNTLLGFWEEWHSRILLKQ